MHYIKILSFYELKHLPIWLYTIHHSITFLRCKILYWRFDTIAIKHVLACDDKYYSCAITSGLTTFDKRNYSGFFFNGKFSRIYRRSTIFLFLQNAPNVRYLLPITTWNSKKYLWDWFARRKQRKFLKHWENRNNESCVNDMLKWKKKMYKK